MGCIRLSFFLDIFNSLWYDACMKTIEIRGIEVSGHFFKYSSPYGKVVESLNGRNWFISRTLTEQELNDPKTSAISKMLKSTHLGVILRFDQNPKRYIIEQLYPQVTFSSLKKAIKYLIDNEGKLVFCS